MGAYSATARSAPGGEHLKARYRVLVLGLLALFGPPAFGIEVGLFSTLYSVALFGYALWGLRLTVVYADDLGLGYLLTLFDVLMTLPLVLWGTVGWLSAAVALLWVGGLSVSASAQRRRRLARMRRQDALIDPVSGFMTASHFEAAVLAEGRLSESRAKPFAVITIRVLRLADLASYFGQDVADRAVACVARRAGRQLDTGFEGFRLSDDRLALVVPACGGLESTELAGAVAQAVRGKVIEGRRVECAVGYALAPRDGQTAEELLMAAEDAVLLPRYANTTGEAQATPGHAEPNTSSPLAGARMAVG